MRKKTIIVSAFTLFFLLLFALDSNTKSGGADPGFTGAPGEDNCATQIGCHYNAPVNLGKYINQIELLGDFHAKGYLPDSTYNITIRYKQKNKSRIGFQTTSLDKNDDPVGALTITSGKTRKSSGTVNGKTREYVTHSTSGTSVTGDSILWTFQWKAPSSNIGDVSFFVALNVTNNNNSTSGDSIYLKELKLPSSGLLPTAIASSDTNIYCAAETITMKGSGTSSPTSYSWTFPGGVPSTSTSQNPTVTWNFKGTKMAILQVKNAYGWSDPDTFLLNILDRPNANIAGTFPATICPDDSIKLTASTGSGYTYLWSTGETTQSIFAKKAGMYSVVVTNNLGCSRQSPSVEIKEYTRPTTTISSNALKDSACAGANITFSGLAGADSIFLYKDFAFVAKSAGDQITWKMDVTADFNVRIKDANSCLSSPSDTIRINVAKPLSAPEVLCMDKTTSTLLFKWQDTTSGHASGYQVSIDSGKSWVSPNVSVNEHSLTGLKPDKNYELWVRAITGFPCFYGAIGKKVCRTGPCNSIDVTAFYDSVVCSGSEVQVNLKGLAGSKFSLSFEQGPPFSDSVFSFEPTISKTYLLELTDSANLGCLPEEVFITVQVDEMGPVDLRTSDGGVMYCEGDTVIMIATNGLDEYKFYINGMLDAITKDSFFHEEAFSNFDSAFVVAQKGVCIDTSAVLHFNIIPLPDAGFTYTRDWKIYSFVPDVAFYTDYLWHFGDGDSSIIMMPTHDYGASEGQTVKATLRVTDSEGCMNERSEDIILPEFSSVIDVSNAGIRIFPNPASGELFVSFTEGFEPGTVMYLTDLNGQVVRTVHPDSNVSVIDIHELSSGIYLLQVYDGTSTAYGRVMID